MRQHLWTIVAFFVAASVLVCAIHAGGGAALVAAVAAAVTAEQLQTLWHAAVDSLSPRTDAEKKYLRRVGRDILSRGRQRDVQQPLQGGGA